MNSESRADIERNDEYHSSEADGAFLDVLAVLLKRRKFILVSTGAVAVLAALISLLIPNRYSADTTLLPPAQSTSMSTALLGQLGGPSALASAAGAGLGIRNPGDMYVSLFLTRNVEDAVIKRFNLAARYKTHKMSDTRVAFETHSLVALGVKDGLIRITVWDTDAQMAADIANGYVEEFRKSSAALAITEASQRRVFFQQQLLEANESLAAAEEAMKHTEQSTGVLEVDSQAKSLIESAASMRAQIVAKKVQLQGMRTYATDDNPELIQVRQQLAELEVQLAKLGGTEQSSNSDIVMHKGNIPQAGMEYIRKLRDVKYYETITEILAKQLEAARLDEARQGTVIQVADAAVAPDRKSGPSRSFITLLWALIALIASCIWCLARAKWEAALHSPGSGGNVARLRQVFQSTG